MAVNLLKFTLILLVSMLTAVAMKAGFVHNVKYFQIDAGFFFMAFLLSRTVRFFSDKGSGIIRSLFLEYFLSLTYLIFCLFTMPVYSHLNFAISFVMFFLYHSGTLAGKNVLVFLLLASFNGVVRWERLFFIFLQTPTAYLASLLLGITLSDGFASALSFCFHKIKANNEISERLNHYKWWSFVFSIKMFFDEDKDLNLDNIEVGKVKKSKRKSLDDAIFLQLQSPAVLSSSLTQIKRRDGMFSYDQFLKRANSVFIKIRTALYEHNIAEIEHLVSDSLFEQFKYLINETSQRPNRLVSLELMVNDMQIAQVNLDKNFDILHLFVRAVSRDYEARPDEKNISPEQIKNDRSKILQENVFCEYWSFVRKPSAITRDCPGLLEGQCPNCGTPIAIGQATVCPNCSSFIRSGQYDWVLSKITPARSWVYSEPSSLPGWQEILQKDPNFSVQQVEDHCSVIFWLLRNAEKSKNVDGIRRFATNEFCENLLYEMTNDNFGRYSSIIRVTLESTALKGIHPGENSVFCYALIVWHAVSLNKNGKEISRPMRDVLVLARPNQSVTKVNNALNSVHCSSCGGPLSSSFTPNCSFCGSLVSDGTEWVLNRILKENEAEYLNLSVSAKDDGKNKVGSKSNEYQHSCGEIISANDLVTIAAQILMADGRIDTREMLMIENIAARYEISQSALQGILAAVKEGLIYVPVPESKSFGALKLIREATRMALADEKISADEKEAIMNLGMQLGYAKLDVQQIINSELTAHRNRKKPQY